MVLVITIVSFIWAGTSVYIAIEVPQHNAANQSAAVRRAVTSLFLLCSVTKPDWLSKMIQDNVQDPIPAGTFPLSFGWMMENRSSPHYLDVMVNCLFDKVARQTVDSLKVYCLNSIKLVETGNQNSQTRLGNHYSKSRKSELS